MIFAIEYSMKRSCNYLVRLFICVNSVTFSIEIVTGGVGVLSNLPVFGIFLSY